MIAATTLLLSLALSAYAAPSKRQSEDNGSCQALQTECAATVKSDLSDAWNIKACVFGASCFGGQHPVDGFLAAVWADRGESGSAPASVSLPRVTSSLFSSISTDGKTVSQQNFIDGYYSSLDATGGPYPTSADYVIGLFSSRLQDWTGFCSASIPFQNFADYYQYSSSVDSSICSGTTTTVPVTSTPAQTSSAPASTSTGVVSSDATCQKMFTTCVAQIDVSGLGAWGIEACVLGATCFGGQHPVDGFLAAVYKAKNPTAIVDPPTSINEPNVGTGLLTKISTDGKTWTQQNFIDAWYGTLSSVGGPFPPNTDLVVSYFNRILEWTAFCPGTGIPFQNIRDYFQYSATVQGGTAQC